MIKQLVSVGVAGLALVAVLTLAAFMPSMAANDTKIRICHAANAVNNPYQTPTVDYAAANGNTLGDHISHTGPVPANAAEAQAIKDAGIGGDGHWGDIIPAIPGVTDGLNWTALGQAIYNNDCNYPEVASAALLSTTPATCEAGEILHYGAIAHATFSGTADGTEGPANYNVVATADNDALFAAGSGVSADRTTKTFSGSLAGPLTGPQCEEVVPEVASASVSVTDATCQSGEVLHYGAISNATYSGTADGTEGPASYNVVATADDDALFVAGVGVSGDRTTVTYSGSLAGPDESLCPNEEEPSTATASVSVTDATCEVPATLHYGAISNATFSGTADGTTGPGSYNVVATADDNALFVAGAGVSDDRMTKTFSGSLDATLTGEDCVLGDTDTDTPTTPTPTTTSSEPEVLPDTSSDTPVALLAVIAGISGLIALSTFGLGNLFGRKL